MSLRTRAVVIALPVVLTVVLAVAIGGLVVIQDQRQAEQIAQADAVAQDYLADVASFRSAIVKRIADDDADPDELERIVDSAIAKPPRLAGAPSYGRRHSTAYAEAVQTRDTVLAPFRRLRSALREADVARDFIGAARSALGLRASDYIGFGQLTSSAPLRTRLIPAFVRARDEFDRVRVPTGQDELAGEVHDAVQYVIDRATLLADRIEQRQSFSFSYAEQFRRAAESVEDYATTVKGDLAEAINEVTADA